MAQNLSFLANLRLRTNQTLDHRQTSSVLELRVSCPDLRLLEIEADYLVATFIIYLSAARSKTHDSCAESGDIGDENEKDGV